MSAIHLYKATNFVTGYANLRILRLGGNKFGDDGLLMLMEAFQDKNVLMDFGVWNCNISSKGRVDVNA